MKLFNKIMCLALAASFIVGSLASCSNTTGNNNETTAASDTTAAQEITTKPNKGGIILNELMPKNKNVLIDDFGEYSDWIELYNSSESESICLEGYMLSDSPGNAKKYHTLPAVTLEPGAYYVVYASGRDSFDASTVYCHLAFKVSDGEAVALYNPLGSEIGRITVKNVPDNLSCGPDSDGKTVIFATPTPGNANVSETVEPQAPTTDKINTQTKDTLTVRINEYATNDSVTYVDQNGDFAPWAELFNYGDNPVSLKGLFISDDTASKEKYALPDETLEAGEYKIVVMNSNDTEYSDEGEIQASFTLSGKETTLGIYNGAGVAIDECNIYELTSNLSCGRSYTNPDTWLFFPSATPGKANTGNGFTEIKSANYPSSKILVINEAAAVNASIVRAKDSEYYDYIELYNPTSDTLSLADYYIGTSSSKDKIVQLPTVDIKGGGYLLLYLSNTTEYRTKTKEAFVNLGLNRYGEDLYLFNSDYSVIDSIFTGRQRDGVSVGRKPDMTDSATYYFTTPTPLEKNSETVFEKITASPEFYLDGGYVDANTQIEIKSPEGSTVYYTTDGSTPTNKSKKYDGAITITKTTAIRAIAYSENALPSDEISTGYVVGRKHSIPVIFITTDSDNLFSDEKGLFVDGPNASSTFPYKGANFWEDWEREIRFDYIDENGYHELSLSAGIKIFGQYSRAKDQKSISVYFKDKYGPKEVCYPFFGNDTVNVFSSIALRTSGQDGAIAHIRDAYFAKVVRGQMDLDIMDYEPCVAYVNGEYYGLYDMRERINENYISNHTGADPDNVDLIKSNSNVLEGSIDEYKKLTAFLENNSLTNDENYKKACEMVDIESLMNYWICECFFSNTDTGNIKFYKERKDGAKWRWILFDLDWGLFPSTYKEYNMLDEVLNPAGHGVGNSFSTLVLCSFMKNDSFKDEFLTKFGKYLKTTFAPDRITAILDELTKEIDEEMKYHIEKWCNQDDTTRLSSPYSYEKWQKNVTRLRDISIEQNQNTIDHIVEHFKLSTAEKEKYFS